MKKIKDCINELTMKIAINIARKMSPVVREAIDNPENLKFEGRIKKDEIIVKIKIKEDEA